MRRRAWAPVGERPLALGHHRYEWLYVTAFVQPTNGETVWYLSDGVSKPFFEKLLADFAETVEAGRKRRIVLVLDNAGWHGEAGLAVPNGVRLVFLPPYTPELQPAERLWSLVDEPIANRCSTPSPKSTPFLPKDAASSSTNNRKSPKRPTSHGGQSQPNRTNQTNPVISRQGSHRNRRRSGRYFDRLGGIRNCRPDPRKRTCRSWICCGTPTPASN